MLAKIRRFALTATAVTAVAVALPVNVAPNLIGAAAALAQEEGHGGNGPKYQGGGTGGHDGGSGGADAGHDGSDDSAHGAPGESGKGPRAGGGGEDEPDGHGPQAGQPSSNQGGKPVWAQEGIPEVELGRMNVVRSPDKVLARALTEVVSNFDTATEASLYSGSASAFAQEVTANWDTVTYIDAPLQNLALLKELWTTQQTSLPGVTPENLIELSAIFVGTASDKALPVTSDAVLAIATIFRVTMPSSVVEAIAVKAEDVRQAIALAHG